MLLLWSSGAQAGSFDYLGNYLPDPSAAQFVDFSTDFDPVADRFVPADAPEECLEPRFEQLEAADALSGKHLLHIQTDIFAGCAERFLVKLPATKASYRASVWARHGGLDAQLTVIYPEDSGREIGIAKLSPSGRVTSDGWIELVSNDLPIDGSLAETVYLRVYDIDEEGSDLDALEILSSGEYVELDKPCSGLGDPVCGEGQVCMHQRCRLLSAYVPPLPSDAVRDSMVDVMLSQLRVQFGGRKTRLMDLPEALTIIEQLRYVESAWAFWNGYGKAIRRLHDWHTRLSGAFQVARTRRLNACFIEGDGDTSAGAWPKHPKYGDILVSHTGTEGAQGLRQGDRLVAVDGKHPYEWALSLRETDWGWWQANDDIVLTELAERMRGLIIAYATSFSFIRCDKGKQSCDAVPTTVKVSALPEEQGGTVRCDNRPYYHFTGDNNPNANHNVGWNFFLGRVVDTQVEEEIHGLLWDTLYGGGDPKGHVNKNLTDAYALFKAKARGVILDHRAGSGGTLDGAETATQLMMPAEPVLVFQSPIEHSGYDGPADKNEGLAIFNKFLLNNAMVAGSSSWAQDLPVALLTHRDGSASDFFPFAVKGAPKTKIFGPAPTAGAFSTYYNYEYWGPIALQLASGDSISKDGEALIGQGVVPDFIVLQKQSDILAGKDTIHEAALAWLRQELKPL